MCDGDPCCRAVFVMGYYIFQKSAQLEVRKFHSVPGSADSVLFFWQHLPTLTALCQRCPSVCYSCQGALLAQ